MHIHTDRGLESTGIGKETAWQRNVRIANRGGATINGNNGNNGNNHHRLTMFPNKRLENSTSVQDDESSGDDDDEESGGVLEDTTNNLEKEGGNLQHLYIRQGGDSALENNVNIRGGGNDMGGEISSVSARSDLEVRRLYEAELILNKNKASIDHARASIREFIQEHIFMYCKFITDEDLEFRGKIARKCLKRLSGLWGRFGTEGLRVAWWRDKKRIFRSCLNAERNRVTSAMREKFMGTFYLIWFTRAVFIVLSNKVF